MVLESNTLDVLFVKDGQQGEDGKILYTWIKYAKDASGTGITDDPNGAIYIGISYNNESSIESNDPTQYAWTKIQGADGKKGEDAYTIFLENENISFATDENRNPLSEQAYTSGITIMKGTKPVTDFTIGDITKTQGIAVAKTNTAIAISVVNGNPLPNDSGEIVIPITVGGTVFKKILTWTCAKKGEQGDKGDTGQKGQDGEKFSWNLINNGKGNEKRGFFKNFNLVNATEEYGEITLTSKHNYTAVDLPGFVLHPRQYEVGKKVTWSYDIMYTKWDFPTGSNRQEYWMGQRYTGAPSGETATGQWVGVTACDLPVVGQNGCELNKWFHVEVTKTIPTQASSNVGHQENIIFYNSTDISATVTFRMKNVKLEYGDTATPWSPSQSDLEGRGVVETVQYYLATSQASGVTSSTSGWSTDITTQKLTADKKYLWNCYQTKYSDGTSEPISTPNVIGVYGDKGTSTKIIRTGYKYTQNNIDTFSASGYSGTWDTADATTGLKVGDNVLLRVKNTTKGSDCLIFASITTIPSNYSLTCTSYGLIDNGADGQDGEDGAGFHWNLLKYSGDLSKQVLGGAGTYTATVESIEDKTTPSGQAEKITYTVQGTGGKFIQTGKYIKEGDIKQGKTYTVSVWCKCSSIKSTGVINAEFLDNKTYVNPTLSTEWQQYVVTGVANKDVTSTSSASAISFYYSDNMSVGDIFYISSPKVEEGDKASPWCTTYEETLAKNLSITPSSQYFKSTDGGKTFAPNAITIKPTIQGEISFGKWQYSIDGGVSFTDVVSGQKGLTISNNVLAVSKDSSLYSDAVTMITFRAVADDSSFYDTCSIAKIYDVSDIGDGRNLLWNSNFAKTDEAITGTTNSWGLHTRGTNLVASIDTSTKHNGFNTLKTVSAANGDKNSSNDLEWFAWGISERTSNNLHSKNQNYTLSFYAKASVTTDFIVRWGYDAYGADTTRTLTTNWQKYEIKLHQATSAYSITIIFKLLTAGTVWFSEFKLEKGSSATGYSTAPEDLQTAILSTKSEISDVSLKVDNNKQAIEQRVEKTTYEQDLKLVKGDISKANEGLNKWRYEIYPKSLFADKPEDQSKYDIGVFIRNKNLTPSRTLVFDDNKWTLLDYENNYIGYGLTFVKMSAKKTFSTKWAHSSSCSIYVNGKLIISDKGTVRLDSNNTGRDFSCTFIEGWNCIEFVMQETIGNEWFFFKDAISAISECQLMNCYYGTPVARQSHITNQLVQNTTDIDGVSGSVQKVMSTVGGSGKVDEFVNNYSTWKKKVDGIETRVGKTYVTKNDFDGLEIGGVNLFVKSTASRGWWISDTGVLNANGGWGYSDYINVSGMKNYIASGFTNLGISPATCFYDSNKTFISGVQSTNQNSQDSKRKTLPIPSNAKYMRFSFMLVDIDTLKIEQGTKATAYSPAPEDDEINGQNLVSNLPSNWEQGTVTEGSTTGTTYANTKSSSAGSVRPKELIPVSGNITISTAYSNQSKKPIRHWIAAYDVNKNYLGNNYVSNAWNSFPRTLNMKDAKYIAIMVGYTDSSAITPSDISQICLKIERGTSATPFTLAPEDVNGKIVNVETIANQTAKKFEWIVKGGDKSSSMVLTDDFLNIVANKINLKGKVTFESLSSDAKSEIGKVAQSKVDGLEVGGRNLLVQKNITQGYLSTDGKGSFISSGGGDQTSDWIDVSGNKYITVTLYEDFTNTNNSGRYCEYDADKNCINTVGYNPRQKSSIIIELKTTTKYIRVTAIECKTRRYKIETGNKPTDWTPAPEDVSQDATNKASQALTDAKNYSSSAVNWVTNNGSSTISLNAMVKKWTDGAVSDTAQINGGWIKANTITASKIALADFTNYSQLTRDTADAYGFTVTDDTDGTWFSTKNIKRDQFISEIFPCNGGESYLIEYDISTNAKGANNSTDTKNYIGVAIGVYGYTGTVGSNGLPNKATNIWYADRITGSETAPSIHVKTTITTSTATKQFRVFLQSNGYYFEGTTKIRNLSVRRMYGGTLIVDGSITADKIATDAIKSRNYISSGGTQGSFLNLSDGSFTSPNLSWDSNGNLIAKNANLSGEITATNGSIAGWTIISNKMYTTGSGKYTGIGKYGSAYAFWAGATSNDNGNSAVFKVSHTGKLTATDADITGTITATNGKIGRYDITSTYLMTNSGSNASGIGGNQAFWAGAEDSNSAPFRVGYDGVLWAENAAIRGSIETGNLGDEGDTVSIINGHIGIQGTSNNVEIYSTGFKFGIDGDYYLMSVSEGVKCYRNLYATDFVADGWLYCSEVHSSGAVVIGADSESFYWAHGYQIARGTSWGGVCVGDDSQQLRLYGSSIWASHSISTSDENLKENFTTLDQYENFYMNLNPIGFNYIGDYDGKKTHFGFGAHKTEDVLESEGYDADKFAVVTHRPLVQEDIEKRFGKDVEVDIETEYGVSYTEFIALNTHMIQKTRRELTKVKQEKADLEVRLQAIEAKLGL